MNIQERSYSSKVFMPKPLISQSTDKNLVSIAFSWTGIEHAEKITSEMMHFMESAQSDIEATSPFEYLPTLTKDANNLRIAMLLGNELLWRTENQQEYAAGVEALLLLKRGNYLSWAKVGQPQLFLNREEVGLHPLCVNFQFREPPLPQQILGQEKNCLISSGTIAMKPQDQLLLFAGTAFSAEAVGLNARAPLSLSLLTKHIADFNSNSAFWIGLVE